MTVRTQFNDELFESALLCIDDEATRSPKERAELGAKLKQFVAASDIRRHAKYMKPVSIPARNRLIWCANYDPDAISILPKLEDGVGDKINLFKVDRATVPMDTATPEGRQEFWKAIDAELPALGYYLIEFELPEEHLCKRFGVATFHHPQIAEALSQLEYENRLLELIDVCFETDGRLEVTQLQRKPNGSKARAWVGRAMALQGEICRWVTPREAQILFTHGNSCGRMLRKAVRTLSKQDSRNK